MAVLVFVVYTHLRLIARPPADTDQESWPSQFHASLNKSIFKSERLKFYSCGTLLGCQEREGQIVDLFLGELKTDIWLLSLCWCCFYDIMTNVALGPLLQLTNCMVLCLKKKRKEIRKCKNPFSLTHIIQLSF